jgi:LPS export ABC transporter permease LptG/LPS export ABC transporter permease LptF
MGILSRTIFFEIASSAFLGAVLFTFVLFLQKAGQLFSVLVNSSAKVPVVGYLFLLVLPSTLPLTLPLGVLVGTLIALSRMSSDGEITAARASGVSGRKVVWPVAVFAVLAMIATGAASLWLTPLSIRETIRLVNQLGASQLTAEIQPRVFDESFPNTILYVGDVVPSKPVHWYNVFIADLTPPAERKSINTEKGEGPRITLANEAIASPDVARNRIQLDLKQGSSYEASPDPAQYNKYFFATGEQVLEAKERAEKKAKLYTATDTIPLMEDIKTSPEARIEFHQRLALPLACLLLALTGIPLGVSSRKGGKSVAFVITVAFAFLYYVTLISLVSLARDGKLPVEIAVWTPNFCFAVAALVLLFRLELPGDHDVLGSIRGWFTHQWERLRGLADAESSSTAIASAFRRSRFFLLPQIIDTYVLTNFSFYFVILLVSFVGLTEFYNFFELLGDVFRNQIPMSDLFRYLLFLSPKLIYDATPISVLVAVLVTFGIFTKNNEITAMKASGVSLFRLAMPIFLATLALSGALFAFDHYVVPGANLIQDSLRNKIKGRPVQTYLTGGRKWIVGERSRIYYYKYFNPDEGVMGGVSVFEFDEKPFRLRSQLSAERARWEPSLKEWVFQNGWAREIHPGQDRYQAFQGGTATFPQFTESPAYFMMEVKAYKQMNYQQLDAYIDDLQKGGFNTIPFQVQYHKKFSQPLFALIMALLSVPFAFLTGGKGAMTGVGVSFGIAIAYFAINTLSEQLGSAALLPPTLAAWAPDALFALVGLYLLTRLRT